MKAAALTVLSEELFGRNLYLDALEDEEDAKYKEFGPAI